MHCTQYTDGGRPTSKRYTSNAEANGTIEDAQSKFETQVTELGQGKDKRHIHIHKASPSASALARSRQTPSARARTGPNNGGGPGVTWSRFLRRVMSSDTEYVPRPDREKQPISHVSSSSTMQAHGPRGIRLVESRSGSRCGMRACLLVSPLRAFLGFE